MEDSSKQPAKINEICDTPWGRWEVLLDADYCKVKRITVNTGKRLSYQKHFKREERWIVVQGTATVTLDGVISHFNKGEVITIPFEAAHRVSNKKETPLIFIEVQLGTYFGEDDLVRLEDDFGRN